MDVVQDGITLFTLVHLGLQLVAMWYSGLQGSAQMDEGENCVELFARMRKEGVAPGLPIFAGAPKPAVA